MRQLLIRVANILKVKNVWRIPRKRIKNLMHESPDYIRNNMKLINGKVNNILHESPQVMKKLLKNVPQAMGRLRKRVVDNKIIGNDARNLFTVSFIY